MGIVASETKSEVVLLMPGGTSTTIEKNSIKERVIDTNSLMPALVGSMDKQELVDLVTFLSELKAK
jgi:putative heme-binding domain-containing protein